MDFTLYASKSTIDVRTKQLIALGLIEHHLLRGTGKRREWYTLTERGKRVLKVTTELKKHSRVKESLMDESCYVL